MIRTYAQLRNALDRLAELEQNLADARDEEYRARRASPEERDEADARTREAFAALEGEIE